MKLISLVMFSISLFIIACLGMTTSNENQQTHSGADLYKKYCKSCHKPDGTGTKNIPPLAQSDYLLKNKVLPIKALLFGLKKPIIVNGEEYDKKMPPTKLTDEEIAEVLNYVRNQWGNKAEAITPTEVAAIRKAGEVKNQ